MCAQFPEKAREVRTGALNAVETGGVVFIESTAEGQEGDFYDKCQTAQTKQRTGAVLTPMDFKFHFYPWQQNPEYELDPAGVVVTDPMRRYFDKLEKVGVVLSDRKRAWYVKKAETQLADMKREYPSTPQEAFEASLEGAYYAEPMAIAETQGRIAEFKAREGVPVHTAWDLGVGDATAIWFFQVIAGKLGLVGYYQNSGEGMPFYLDKLKDCAKRLGWTYGTHFMPHDIRVKEFMAGRTRAEQLKDMGLNIKVVGQHSVEDGINAARMALPICHFDEEECAEGLKALRAYRKEWDEDKGVWKNKPRHDWASHGADAFRYLAMGWREADNDLTKEQIEEQQRKEREAIIAEMIRPKTYTELVEQYLREQEMEADEAA
jgi:hypothetical protein